MSYGCYFYNTNRIVLRRDGGEDQTDYKRQEIARTFLSLATNRT